MGVICGSVELCVHSVGYLLKSYLCTMGTSLIGLLPQNTYSGLIKIGDNTAIDSTLKTVSDGAGNDLPMQASTSAINFTATLTQSGVALQPVLVSGTNIKTVNSTSLLGSGNVAVQATITGAATTITTSDLTVSRALTSNASGKVAVSATTDTELGYVSGVTSAIQTQINTKQQTLSTVTTAQSLNGQVLQNFIPNQASTSVSLNLDSTNAATYNSSVITLTGALTINFDASLPNGFNVTLIQLNAFSSTITGTGGLVIGNRQGHTKNNGQYSVVSIIKYTNVLAILGGDTSV